MILSLSEYNNCFIDTYDFMPSMVIWFIIHTYKEWIPKDIITVAWGVKSLNRCPASNHDTTISVGLYFHADCVYLQQPYTFFGYERISDMQHEREGRETERCM